MYCRQCGYNNDNYNKICKRCGSMLYENNFEDDDYYITPPDMENREGGLRFAPKKEPFSEKLKRRFARLRRASSKHLNRTTVISAACVLIACVLIAGIIFDLRVKSRDTAIPYGNDCCNIMQNCFAASDGDFLYYSSPYGTNPGLYRTTLSTGQTLKIAFRTLTSMSVLDGWIYGIDETGTPLRISSDGTVTQYICDDSPVSCLSVAGDYCYFLSSSYHMYRVGLDFPDAAGSADNVPMNRADPEQLGRQTAGTMLLNSDRIYYTLLTMTENTPEAVSSGDSYFIPICSSTGYPTGQIWSMALDGSDAAPIVEEETFAMSTRGSYIYFFTESTETVSYTDVYPPSTETTQKTKKTRKKTTTTEPPPKNIDVIRLHSWRYSMRTDGYASFLADDQSVSPIYLSGSSIYYISKDGNLMTAGMSGLDEVLIPTDTQKIDSVFEIDGYVYYSSEQDSMYGRIKEGSVRAEIISSY